MLYQLPYNLVSVASIQNYLISDEVVRAPDDKALYNASLEIEARQPS
jgi:hypothetical protein